MNLLAILFEQSDEKGKKRSNPHKYLLYRPTFSQFFVFLSTAFKVLGWRFWVSLHVLD